MRCPIQSITPSSSIIQHTIHSSRRGHHVAHQFVETKIEFLDSPGNENDQYLKTSKNWDVNPISPPPALPQ